MHSIQITDIEVDSRGTGVPTPRFWVVVDTDVDFLPKFLLVTRAFVHNRESLGPYYHTSTA